MKQIVITLGLCLALALTISACTPESGNRCKFKNGETVSSMIDGKKGQIVAYYPGNCSYSVRFQGYSESYETYSMQEYEIVPSVTNSRP